MADVTVEVAGRDYRLACADGEEPHLRRLAAAIDGEAQKLLRSLRSPPEEGRLLLMVSLMLADRLKETEETAAALEAALAEAEAEAAARAVELASAPQPAPDLFSEEEERARAARVERLAERLEHLAGQVEMHGEGG